MKKIYYIVLTLFCLCFIAPATMQMSMINGHCIGEGKTSIDDEGKLTVEADSKIKTDNEEQSGIKKTISDFYKRYKHVLAWVLALCTLSGVAGIIILLINLSALGDNSWIVRRQVVIGLATCAVATAVLGSLTFILGVFYGLFK